MPRNNADADRIMENLEGVTFFDPQELETATAVAKSSSRHRLGGWFKRVFKFIYHRTDVY